MKFFNKKIKKMKWFDVTLIKWGAAAGIILVFKIIPGGIRWLDGVNIWWFIILTVVFVARPTYLMFKK